MSSAAARSPIARTVECPSCGAPTVYMASNRYRPFCSERCKNLDFGVWASEGYRVPDKSSSDDNDPNSMA